MAYSTQSTKSTSSPIPSTTFTSSNPNLLFGARYVLIRGGGKRKLEKGEKDPEGFTKVEKGGHTYFISDVVRREMNRLQKKYWGVK